MITLIVPKKRYKGVSDSGYSHRFTLSSHGKHWYFIPVKFVKSISYYRGEKVDEMIIKMEFSKDALSAYGTGDDLGWSLTVIKRQENVNEQVINLFENEESETNH